MTWASAFWSRRRRCRREAPALGARERRGRGGGRTVGRASPPLAAAAAPPRSLNRQTPRPTGPGAPWPAARQAAPRAQRARSRRAAVLMTGGAGSGGRQGQTQEALGAGESAVRGSNDRRNNAAGREGPAAGLGPSSAAADAPSLGYRTLRTTGGGGTCRPELSSDGTRPRLPKSDVEPAIVALQRQTATPLPPTPVAPRSRVVGCRAQRLRLSHPATEKLTRAGSRKHHETAAGGHARWGAGAGQANRAAGAAHTTRGHSPCRGKPCTAASKVAPSLYC